MYLLASDAHMQGYGIGIMQVRCRPGIGGSTSAMCNAKMLAAVGLHLAIGTKDDVYVWRHLFEIAVKLVLAC